MCATLYARCCGGCTLFAGTGGDAMCATLLAGGCGGDAMYATQYAGRCGGCALFAAGRAGDDAMCATLLAGRAGRNAMCATLLAGRAGRDAMCATLLAGRAGDDVLCASLLAGGRGAGGADVVRCALLCVLKAGGRVFSFRGSQRPQERCTAANKHSVFRPPASYSVTVATRPKRC